jgi:hypothetical protein
MSVRMAIRGVMFVFLFGALVLAQDPSGTGAVPHPSGAEQSQSAMPATLPQAGDDLSQMRNDLNKMDSLNLNMSSEIEFLHDQNLQILLRTNSQMWTILIRDLQRQLARQEQQKAAAPPPVKR